MARRYISVRVVDSGGKSVYYAKVTLWIYQFAASGSKEKYTDHDGLAQFDEDMDGGAEVSISVNSSEKVKRSSPKAQYTVVA